MSKQLKLVLIALLVAGVLGLVARWAYQTVTSKPIARQAKLVDCTGAVLKCSFTVRQAHAFSMVIATPDLVLMDWDASRRPPFEFTGRVQISTGSRQVAEFDIDASRTRQCNWLHIKGIPVGFILTDHLYTNSPGLQQYLTPGQEHHFTFSFQRPPATNTSIWMTWLERYGDFRRNRE